MAISYEKYIVMAMTHVMVLIVMTWEIVFIVMTFHKCFMAMVLYGRALWPWLQMF